MTIARGFRSCAWHLFVTLDELVAELCEGGMQEVALRVPIVGAVDAGSPEHLMALALVVI